MANVKNEMLLNAGARTAQLLLFLCIKAKTTPVEETGGDGRTGKRVFWRTAVHDERSQSK